MTAADRAGRDAEDLAVVVAVVTALAAARPALPVAKPSNGWRTPVLRPPLPAAGPGTWWQSGLPG